ncbi:DUF4422 domain-containing protein [Ottowia thiooxydans]|uniref:SAM-dependent methyltransferase n=1 Tax=Ottowia thiooxydans TaxID=219182 RepID=A0ABV2Q1L3_9BURK
MLNHQIRYQRILRDSPELADPLLSVLEVGRGSQNISDLLQRKVTTLQAGPRADPASAWTEPVAGSLFCLPFADNAFDYVVCVDALQFVAKPERARALNELVRVARREVILSLPCGSPARQSDLELALALQRAGKSVPLWLQERFIRALPQMSEMVELLSRTGIRFEIHTNEALLQHYSGLLLDLFHPFSSQIQQRVHQKKSTELVLPAHEWEIYYSYRFQLFKADRISTAFRAVRSSASHGREPGAAMYAVYHKRLPLATGTGITPVYVGEAAQNAFPGERAEAAATSPDNKRWCELSGINEVWRNGPKTEFVGFCHYRRFLDFSRGEAQAHAEASSHTLEGRDRPRTSQLTFEAYTDRAADTARHHAELALQSNPDTILTALPLDVGMNVWDQYASVHNANDLCEITNLIVERHPYLTPFLAESFGSKAFYANNLFVTHWEHFDELCSIWFDVLGIFDEKVPARVEDSYQRRDISFLSERIFDAWVRYRVSQGTRLVTLPILEIVYPGLDVLAWSRVPSTAS